MHSRLLLSTIFRRSAAVLLILQILLLTTLLAQGAATFDVAADYTLAANPNGAWSYGSMSNLTGLFIPLPHSRTFNSDNGVAIGEWNMGGDAPPHVNQVLGPGTAVSAGGAFVGPAGTVYFTAGFAGTPQNFGVIRFTTPVAAAGQYQIHTAVQPLFDGALSADADFHITLNGQELFAQNLAPNQGTGYTNTLSLAVGDTLDFAVGRGADGVLGCSGLKIQLRIVELTNAPCIRHAARATAKVVGGFVVGATMVDLGCGYTNPPTVLIQGGGGTGAQAVAQIASGSVTNLLITNAGFGYTNTPTILIGSPPFPAWLAIGTRTVAVVQHVVLGNTYALDSSFDLVTWTQQGPDFVADSETITNIFDVQEVGQYFRLRVRTP